MDAEKQRHLEQSGWIVGTAAEFLGLTLEEVIILDSTFAADDALIHESHLLRDQASSWPPTFDGEA